MLKTKTINKTITTMLILLLTLSMLNVINFIAIPRVSAVTPVNITQPTVGIAVNETGYWKAGGTYTTSTTPIQAAINLATSPNLNITVAAGAYTETVDVNRTLTLQGASSATVTVTAFVSGFSVFNVTASVNMSGFTVSGANEAYGGEPQPAGIYLASGAVSCNISNNELTDNFDGIKLGAGSNYNTLTNNTLSSNAGQGFEIVNSTYNTFTNNNASSNTRYGFKLENASHNTFTGNTANSNGKYGFHLVKGGGAGDQGYLNNTFTGNTANSNTEYGLREDYGNLTTLTGNTFNSNLVAGIRLKENITNLMLYNNSISGSPIGIDIATVATNVTSWTLIHNNIAGNTLFGVSNTGTGTLNATLNWWGSASGPGYTGGVGGLGTGDNVSDPTYVQYVPWLNAAYPGGVSTTPFSITPTATKGSVTKWFNITVQNIGSPAAVDYVNVTYPSSFTLYTYRYPAGWTQSHDMTGKTVNFIATGGYELSAGETARFDFQMSASTSSGDFKILCRNLMGGKGYQNLTISVDASPPSAIVITAPTVTYYTVGAGNRIWINGTITDDTYNTPSVAINDTTYFPLNPQIGPTYNASATSYTWYFSYYNTSAVPDGYLTVNLTGTDAAGNVMTVAQPASTIIDNTAPTLISFVVTDDKIGNLTAVGSAFYMSANAAGLNFTVTFAEAHPCTSLAYISNGTTTTTQSFTNNTWFYTGSTAWYNVTGVNTITINNITITDLAQPNNNTLVTGSYSIYRDLISPAIPTFTATPICGGLVIKNLNSTDNVGVLNYQIYVNGTSFLNVTVTQLATTTLASVAGALNTSHVFDGALVLNLTNYAGNYANLTIRAVDVGGNVGNFSTPTVYTIPQGQWYPIELQPDWNLLGLPLIPADTSRAAVLSLILKQGASGVIVYGYNSATSTFTLNPATMTDGNGYWIYMAAYDVMIVSGRVSAPPPALPPNYDLVTGWNLVGYKSTIAHNVSSYLASLPSASYFTYIYVWDPSAQTWLMASGSEMLSPGQGFWIYMYSDQTLIPPIP